MNLKPKLILTVGCPGSGKSYWAKQYQKEHPDTVRLNNDELRETLFGRVFDSGDTKVLNSLRNDMELNLLKKFKDLIIDNCNVTRVYHEHYMKIAETWGYELIIKDFSKVPLELCFQRNKERGREVPEHVILSMKASLDELMNDFYGHKSNRDKVTFW